MARIEKPILGAKNEPRWHRRDAQKLLQSISRYTRFVSFTKVVLGGLSLLMIGTIVIMPLLHGDKEGIRLAFSGVQENAKTLPVMTNPAFQGVDEKNQPYYVTADSATQLSAQEISLSNVQGDMLAENNAWLSVKAKKGLINNDTKMMRLMQDVRLYHLDGYEFRTQSVDIDMGARTAKGTQSIAGFGPIGDIKANGFEWDHESQVLYFNGNVRMKVITQHGV